MNALELELVLAKIERLTRQDGKRSAATLDEIGALAREAVGKALEQRLAEGRTRGNFELLARRMAASMGLSEEVAVAAARDWEVSHISYSAVAMRREMRRWEEFYARRRERSAAADVVDALIDPMREAVDAAEAIAGAPAPSVREVAERLGTSFEHATIDMRSGYDLPVPFESREIRGDDDLEGARARLTRFMAEGETAAAGPGPSPLLARARGVPIVNRGVRIVNESDYFILPMASCYVRRGARWVHESGPELAGGVLVEGADEGTRVEVRGREMRFYPATMPGTVYVRTLESR